MNPAGKWLPGDGPGVLAPRDFEQIRELAHRTFGLDLKSGKEDLVASRLRRLVRNGGFASYHELYKHVLEDRTGEALAGMIDALATNHTSFLREPDHFEFLRDHVLKAYASRPRLDVWSAACSTGEEVWTLACVLSDSVPAGRFRIVGSDISRKALAVAERAVYSAERCAGIPAHWISRYFVAEPPSGSYRIHPKMRSQAEFMRVNLMESLPLRRQYPVIFCRNVMIYFDARTQEAVASKLADSLEPGGYLFVGHAESLARVAHSLEYVRPAVYRKAPPRESRWNRS